MRKLLRRRMLAPGLAALGLAWAARAETLTYTITPEIAEGRVQVELTWETEGRPASRLCVVERWGMVADVPALLRDVEFSGGEAQRRGNCWDVRHGPGGKFTCRYTVDPGRTAPAWARQHHPLLTDAYFHGLGNTFLMAPATGGTQPEEYDFVVRWNTPAGWQAVCSWGPGHSVTARLPADAFRHAVYLAGADLTLTERSYALAGQDTERSVTVATCGELKFAASDLAELAVVMIRAQAELVGAADFPAFVVTALALGQPADDGPPRIAGTGLQRSLALFLPPASPLGEELEHLFAHELFHHWNGGVLRAADPFQLVYWFTEGLTDYYALRSLHASGRWDAATLAKWINRHLRAYASNPARNATNEEIQAGYWTERDTVGETPYQRGLLLGIRWNAAAREHGVERGVDQLFAALLEQAQADAGFRLTNAGLRAAGVATLGSWFADEFDRYVTRAETVEVPPDALAPELRAARKPVYAYELGFARERSLAEERVRGLVANSAAARAGLREGDELAGWKILPDPDKKTVLQVRRDDRLQTISYYPRGAKLEVLQFRAATAQKPEARTGDQPEEPAGESADAPG